jgi:hypothetical protein
MVPARAAGMVGSTARVTVNRPKTLVSKTLRASLSDVSSMAPTRPVQRC